MGSDDPTALEVAAWLGAGGVRPGGEVGLALAPGVGLGVAAGQGLALGFACDDPASVVGAVDDALRPRWVWWGRATADVLVAGGVAISRCWDALTVHRMLHGGWRTSVAEAWAWLHDLASDALPAMGQLGLLDAHGDEGDDPEEPVRPDGYLRPEWTSGGWATSTRRLARWAELVLEVRRLQGVRLAERPFPERAQSTARSESAAEFLCAELSRYGLPIDVVEAERIILAAVGPRPLDSGEAAASQLARDELVLRHLPAGTKVDLRNPAEVRTMLRRLAIDVPNTRASQLELHRRVHPVVDDLLAWRKAERIATTYGYRWLDEHVRGGRLRGEWSSSDGAAGRMTASAGLHNLPAEMRSAVAADPDHVFVRADLGQIEPRVLASVSGDRALIAATTDDDLYQPVAQRLQVPRDVAKVAVLGAMYGSTTGVSAPALRGLERAYPMAMSLLEDAAAEGRAGNDVVTVGGRRVRMWVDDSVEGDLDRARNVAAARGRFARNALIQGAAAEFFKVWAVTVRARTASLGARIALCLHDELLVHCVVEAADDVAELVLRSLDEASSRWSLHDGVRFVADVSVVHRWSDAKASGLGRVKTPLTGQ
jgi:DNA polymerase-1